MTEKVKSKQKVDTNVFSSETFETECDQNVLQPNVVYLQHNMLSPLLLTDKSQNSLFHV